MFSLVAALAVEYGRAVMMCDYTGRHQWGSDSSVALEYRRCFSMFPPHFMAICLSQQCWRGLSNLLEAGSAPL
jgi:hypothetical protein